MAETKTEPESKRLISRRAIVKGGAATAGALALSPLWVDLDE